MKTLLIILVVILWAMAVLISTISLKLNSVENKLNEQNEQIEYQNKKIEKLELNLKESTKGAYLKSYFRAKGSILADYAINFIDVANKYHLAPNLIPAIAGVESGYCKQYVKKSFNCWGFGNIYFNNFPEAIEKIGKTLAEGSAYRKFQKEKTIQAFAINYNAPYAGDYEKKINYFLLEIEQYE